VPVCHRWSAAAAVEEAPKPVIGALTVDLDDLSGGKGVRLDGIGVATPGVIDMAVDLGLGSAKG